MQKPKCEKVMELTIGLGRAVVISLHNCIRNFESFKKLSGSCSQFQGSGYFACNDKPEVILG
jgi:hypothetical protein